MSSISSGAIKGGAVGIVSKMLSALPGITCPSFVVVFVMAINWPCFASYARLMPFPEHIHTRRMISTVTIRHTINCQSAYQLMENPVMKENIRVRAILRIVWTSMTFLSSWNPSSSVSRARLVSCSFRTALADISSVMVEKL